ncbi:MAG: DEAD/DEAH box helicase [Chloroflexota bacterium]|nr:DEAD/DEAH box helicase [Chloroflexota bacterium]
MSIHVALDDLRRDPGFLRNVTTWQCLPSRPARSQSLPANLHPSLRFWLQQSGIENLYLHQAMAWQTAARGENFVVVTPTASGKTLCYNLPILDSLLRDSDARALYLFPTKALAQDQLAALRLADGHFTQHPLCPATYDGDTTRGDRSRIRQSARILLSNPDMLHTGILPHHPRWAEFFAHLRFVVLDELHVYRGVFGSHFANVMRRLRRICNFHGSDPQFFCASATIANPLEFSRRLIGEPVTLIDEDGSPKGERHMVFYNPPLVDPELGLRRSSTLEAEGIAARLVTAGVQTIVFARARLTVEMLLTYLRGNQNVGMSEGQNIRMSEYRNATKSRGQAIRGYRGGYLPNERREIERGLRDGSVRVVVATNALELGVNIGGLDAAVLTGFPGTIASTWQQAGRAGRRTDTSLAILVATAGALDQYIINHPEYVLDRSPEHALINPDNLIILSSHMACAAFELPFRAGQCFGDVSFTEEVLTYLEEMGEVQLHGGDWYWMGEGYPAAAISLRTASPDNVAIQVVSPDDTVKVIGELEREAAPLLLYEGAIYLHEGQSYQVRQLDWDGGSAWVSPVNTDFYTRASSDQRVQVLDVVEERSQNGVIWAHGPVNVVSQSTVFRKFKKRTHETLGYGQIDLPEQVLETDACWIVLTDELLDPLREAGLWRSDPNDYGPNWAQQRNDARARDGYCCMVCGTPEANNRQHDVHHKKPFRAFGYVPGSNENYREANQLENLATLCRRCHQQVERGQRVRTGLGGLAHLVASVAPLHLMCDPRDIGVISEIQDSDSRLPTTTVYEKVPAGIGFSQHLFDLHDVLLVAARDLLRGCPCQAGCPACVGPIPEDTQRDLNAKALTLALVNACCG